MMYAPSSFSFMRHIHSRSIQYFLILPAGTPLPPHPTWEFALPAGWIEQGKDVALDTRRDFVLYPGIDGPLTPSRDAVAHQSSHDWYRGDISARPEDSDAWGLHWYIQRLRETPHSNGAYLPLIRTDLFCDFSSLKKNSSTDFVLDLAYEGGWSSLNDRL